MCIDLSLVIICRGNVLEVEVSSLPAAQFLRTGTRRPEVECRKDSGADGLCTQRFWPQWHKLKSARIVNRHSDFDCPCGILLRDVLRGDYSINTVVQTK